uniref:Uncharacterized protein n=1 Tax=Ditylenchus dipsaci TaxID=166011 RepID=A0A915D1T9_9BILA
MMELLGLIGAAVINAAIYRLAAIYNIQGRMTTPRTVLALAIIEILFALPTMVLATFIAIQITEDQPQVMADVFVKYPKLESFVESQELCIFASLSSNYPIMAWVMVSAICELCGCVVIGVTIWTISIVNLRKRKRQ